MLRRGNSGMRKSLLGLALLFAFMGASVAHAAASQATFLAADTATQGNWRDVCGATGYEIKAFPADVSLASATLSNQSDWVWTESAVDPRAVEAPGQNYRVAECWYNSQTFAVDINLTGGPQQVALY